MENSKITVVANALVKSEKRDLVKAELLKLVEKTRSDKGCISYNLYVDEENENLFTFIEHWENKELLQAHMDSKHMLDFQKAIDGAVADIVIKKMTQVA
ncbi:Quinol monooxygenase YgiN [Gillisia sp. Hel1_33_143]|uniref:putative quinol monooxygenase n=1 Tax=unclassified Gillisia TaxID=2615025 RepID=UPI000552C3E3|nr:MULTISPECIES: putative quinol monooxygenase [unclassified Gillisia]SDS69920.1 Quinol monooxygenase YgiN [Gillisia sp. Hel1_33_143]